MTKRSYSIKLDTVELVKSFVNLATRVNGTVLIKSDRWVIDGKSIMGIFSLDLSKTLSCRIEASEEQIETFEAGLKDLKLL